MPFCNRIQQALLAPILLEPLFDFGVRRFRPLQIALVHDEDVGDLHDARLHRLDVVASAGREDYDRRVRHGRYFDFILAGADQDAPQADKDRVIEILKSIKKGDKGN